MFRICVYNVVAVTAWWGLFILLGGLPGKPLDGFAAVNPILYSCSLLFGLFTSFYGASFLGFCHRGLPWSEAAFFAVPIALLATACVVVALAVACTCDLVSIN